MTYRARRLEHFLSKHLGWETQSKQWACKCGFFTYSHQNYCPDCGRKMPKNHKRDKDLPDQLEQAIAYALGERLG